MNLPWLALENHAIRDIHGKCDGTCDRMNMHFLFLHPSSLDRTEYENIELERNGKTRKIIQHKTVRYAAIKPSFHSFFTSTGNPKR